ncbi:MAG TPA: hypothetical protein VEJ39_02620 [Candidatus Acidoferrales bacterium]|nr:hypothetical protein [Candidatus Acidoferrales bacterium]
MKAKALVLIGMTAMLIVLPVASAVNAHLVNTNPAHMDGSGPAPPPFPDDFAPSA